MTGLDLVAGAMMPEAFGLPNGMRINRRYDSSINAIIHTIRVSRDISVAVTDDLFMEDRHGDIVVPIIQRAALKLATDLRDELNEYIEEMNRADSSDSD